MRWISVGVALWFLPKNFLDNWLIRVHLFLPFSFKWKLYFYSTLYEFYFPWKMYGLWFVYCCTQERDFDKVNFTKMIKFPRIYSQTSFFNLRFDKKKCDDVDEMNDFQLHDLKMLPSSFLVETTNFISGNSDRINSIVRTVISYEKNKKMEKLYLDIYSTISIFSLLRSGLPD